MADVFLSYKREDSARVRKLVAALRARGLDVWWDEDIPPSAPWESTIEQALREAKAVLVCWSPASVASENVRSEARVAREDGRLIQAFVRTCSPPLFFGERQGIDLGNWRGKADDPRISRIVDCVHEIAGGEAGVPAEGPKPGNARFAWSTTPRLVAVAAGLALVIGVAVLIAWRAAVAQPVPQLAVLPFEDLSPAHDKAYFAEGVAEQIQSSLAAEKGLKVLGQTSASAIQHSVDPRTVRGSLGVTHLLEGSTRTAGNNLRVNVRLIDTKDGSALWEQEYRGSLSDIFAVQDKIATGVVQRLRGTLSKAITASTPTAIDAYEAYLAARTIAREPNEQSLTRALGIARQIIDQHPDYAAGHALYADLVGYLSDTPFSYGNIPAETARRIGYAHAIQAIRLAPDKAEGYAALGPWLPRPKAVESYERALSLDPSLVYVRNRLAITLNLLRRNDEAFEQYRVAAEMDPLSSVVINRYAQALAVSGRAGEAMQVIDKFVERSGNRAQGWRFRGNTYRYLAREADHIAARRHALQLDPKLPYQHEWLALSLHLLGLEDEAARHLSAISPYEQLFLANDIEDLDRRIAADGTTAWITNAVDLGVLSLARARNWPALIRFYSVRPAQDRDICVTSPRFSPVIIMALQKSGERREAGRLLHCIQRDISSELAQSYRDPDDVPGELEQQQASLLALRNDPRALDWLDKAVQRGWLGQYFSGHLADWPQFDQFRNDPRYASLQQKVSSKIALERAKVLRSGK